MQISELKNILKEFGANVRYEHNLKKKNWFNIGGKSKVFYKADNLKELVNFLKKIRLLKDYKNILIEEFIGGREIQVAIMGSKKLGAIELKPRRKFYDYKAKYSKKAKTEHIIPVDLSKKNYNKILQIAFKAHKLIGCKGVTRSDFKYHKNNFYLLEINTQPGMTKLSLVPEIARFKGINFFNLIEWILKDASFNK